MSESNNPGDAVPDRTDGLKPDGIEQSRHALDQTLQITQPQQRALVRILAFAHRNRVSPVSFVEQLASEFPGRKGAGLRQFAALVRAGVPVVDALEQTPTALDRSAVMAMRLASETGTLTNMHAALLGDGPPPSPSASEHARLLQAASTPNVIAPGREQPTHGQRAEWFQFFFSFVLAWLVIAFLATFILPTFKHLFDEFGMSRPWALQWLDMLSEFAPIAILIALALFVGWLALGASVQFKNWRTKWPLRISDPDQTPPSASLLSLLAIVVESGRPIASGLDTLARYHHVPRIRQQLSLARQQMTHGESSWESLAKNQLITHREANALAEASSPQTQAWLLRWLTASRKSQFTSRSQWFLRGISMSVLLLLAAIVMLASIAVFITMNSLIGGLS